MLCSITARRWLQGAALLLWASTSTGCGRPPLPNLVLVTIATLRADHCSIHGYGRDTTPVLAQLAREGVAVDRAYAPMASTAFGFGQGFDSFDSRFDA